MKYQIWAEVYWTGLGANNIEQALHHAQAYLEQRLNSDKTDSKVSIEIRGVLEDDK